MFKEGDKSIDFEKDHPAKLIGKDEVAKKIYGNTKNHETKLRRLISDTKTLLLEYIKTDVSIYRDRDELQKEFRLMAFFLFRSLESHYKSYRNGL